MTAVREALSLEKRAPMPERGTRLPRVSRIEPAKPISTVSLIYSAVLTMVAAVLGVLLFNIVVVSQVQHFTAQHRLYDELRLSLAQGTTPIGQVDVNGNLVAPGTPIALLEIPQIGVREVIVEGTASNQTKLGVGHRPDTPLPGQPGASLLMGRAAAYGGPFKNLHKLHAGDTFTVTTRQGRSTYKVIGPRVNGEKLPDLGATGGRLSLETASGGPFLPHGVLTVDAQLVSPAFATQPVAFGAGFIPKSEGPLAGDPSRLFGLSWLLELMLLVTVAAVWAWKRWSHPAMWIVFVPVLGAVGLACADHVCDLLPNLM